VSVLLSVCLAYGTEWPILCWCAIEKLLTHSLTNSITVCLCLSVCVCV